MKDMIASYGLKASPRLNNLFDSAYLPAREERLID